MTKWLISIMLFTNAVQASKATVPLEPQIKRAEYIAYATAMNSCNYCKFNNQAKFKIIENFKGNITENTITVIAPFLSFYSNKKYILFLVKEENGFHWIYGNSSRLVATEKNIKNVKNILRTK